MMLLNRDALGERWLAMSCTCSLSNCLDPFLKSQKKNSQSHKWDWRSSGTGLHPVKWSSYNRTYIFLGLSVPVRNLRLYLHVLSDVFWHNWNVLKSFPRLGVQSPHHFNVAHAAWTVHSKLSCQGLALAPSVSFRECGSLAWGKCIFSHHIPKRNRSKVWAEKALMIYDLRRPTKMFTWVGD